MGSIVTRAKKLRAYRFSAQVVALVALNLRLLNVWFPGMMLTSLQGVCAPGFYCHGCPWATMACPLGVIVTYGRLSVIPFLALGTLALIGTIGGRLVCGWLCPFGWLQDMLYKIRFWKIRIPSALRYVKYAVLLIFVIGIPYLSGMHKYGLTPASRATFCDLCPAGFMETLVPDALLQRFRPDDMNAFWGGFTTLFYIKLGITLSVLWFSLMVSRGFCRVLCPLGAIFGLFNRFSLFRYGLTYHKCADCGACAKNCPVDIEPIKQMNDAECIKCYECTTTRHIKMGVK